MKLRSTFIAAAMLSAAFASAGTQYLMSYSVGLDQSWVSWDTELIDFVIANNSPGVGSMSTTHGDGFESLDTSGENVLTDPFPNDELPQCLLIGIAKNLSSDDLGEGQTQEHIVLGMDSTAASLGANIAWGTLFPNTLEESLIGALHTIYNDDATEPEQNQAIDSVFQFMRGDAMSGILDNLGASHSAFFSSLGSDVSAQEFTIMAWSDGTQIGSGSVTAQAVPEPASIAALAVGLAGLAFRRRRA